MPNSTTAVSASGLSYLYGERRALDNISFEANSGEFIAILGPNGGGKTTLFRIIATLASPDSGTMTIFGDDVVGARNRVRQHLGVVFQSPALDIKLTVRENLLHHGHLHGISGSNLKNRIDQALKHLELDDRRNDLVETLSGGLKRRVELAKVMLTEPRLLLLDEPTSGLDPLAREGFWHQIKSLREATQNAVLYTTHLLEEAEDADRVIILDQGRIVADGVPDALRAQIAGQIVRFRSRDLEGLKTNIRERFAVDAQIEGDSIRLTVDDGNEFAVRASRSLGTAIESVEIARPTLYDVFRQRTGRSFAHSERA